MLTDSELLKHLHNVLKTSDLDTATAATVRRRLEEQLDIDLSEKKTYIRKQIDLYLQSHYTNNDNNDNDNKEEDKDDDDEEEEKDLGNVKEKEEESDDDGGSGSVSAKGEESEEGESEEVSEDESDEEDVKSNGKRKKATPNGKKRGGGGFSKPCALSPQLQKLVGEPEMARTEVVKKIWVYIKERDLQNPKNKRKILCDDTMHDIFRVKSIDMFQMNKALSKHIWPLDEEYETAPTVKSSQKSKPKNRVKEETAPTVKSSQKSKPKKRVKEEEPTEKDKRQKTKGSGFTSPHPISEELMQFFDTDESELSRSEVVKRMWKYIKDNDLQDPSDKRKIICDDKLKELFKVDKFVGFTVSKLLSAHFIKE